MLKKEKQQINIPPKIKAKLKNFERTEKFNTGK